jgi:hypothetical protein
MMMSVEHSVEWELAGEFEVAGENLPQCHLVHHKSHKTWPIFNIYDAGLLDNLYNDQYETEIQIYSIYAVAAFLAAQHKSGNA